MTATRALALCLVVLLKFTTPAAAQDPCSPPSFTVNSDNINTLSGWVDRPGSIAAVKMRFGVNDQYVLVDGGYITADGNFWERKGLAPGYYTVSFSAPGCMAFHQEVEISIQGLGDSTPDLTPEKGGTQNPGDVNDGSINPGGPEFNDPGKNPPNPEVPSGGPPQSGGGAPQPGGGGDGGGGDGGGSGGGDVDPPGPQPVPCEIIYGPDGSIWHPCPR